MSYADEILYGMRGNIPPQTATNGVELEIQAYFECDANTRAANGYFSPTSHKNTELHNQQFSQIKSNISNIMSTDTQLTIKEAAAKVAAAKAAAKAATAEAKAAKVALDAISKHHSEVLSETLALAKLAVLADDALDALPPTPKQEAEKSPLEQMTELAEKWLDLTAQEKELQAEKKSIQVALEMLAADNQKSIYADKLTRQIGGASVGWKNATTVVKDLDKWSPSEFAARYPHLSKVDVDITATKTFISDRANAAAVESLGVTLAVKTSFEIRKLS